MEVRSKVARKEVALAPVGTRHDMELLFAIGCIWLLAWLVKRVFEASFRVRATGTRPADVPSRPPKTADVYRPRPSGSGKPRIVFQAFKAGANGPVQSGLLDGLHDAFTGAPLDVRLGLHQCTRCKVYHHNASVAVLQEESGSRCVACGTGSISALTAAQASASRGADYRPDVVTVGNYRMHFDRVVTFEGKVQSVRVSRRGKDYAVMFENAAWTRGLKLVFLRGGVLAVGGPAFIKSLEGRTVRVRGLLINHPRFGPEILISERGMILGISP